MNKTKTPVGVVDISAKPITARCAIASGEIQFSKKAFQVLLDQGSPKGDVMEVARLAGIMAAKRTPEILPLCHPLWLEKIQLTITADKMKCSVIVSAQVKCTGKTGAEMEALTAVSAACLCIYDMMKWASQDMVINQIKLDYKNGGKSGEYKR